MLINRAKNNVKSKLFIRSSSAYPLGTYPKSAVHRKQNSFTMEDSSSIFEGGTIPGFSVGPCYLIAREQESASERIENYFESVLAPVINANSIEVIDKCAEKKHVAPEFGDNSTDTSNSPKYKTMNHQEHFSNFAIQKVSLQNRTNHGRNGKYKTAKPYPRKVKQKSCKKWPKHHPLAKHHNEQKRHASNKRDVGNSFHLVTTSNKIQPLSSKSLPSITSRANYLITKKEEQFVSEKPNCSSAEFDKKGIAQQPRHYVTKIYLSERHSRNLMGIPAAPPCTPFLDGDCEIECIPSMSDIKSQRSITDKLSSLFKKQSKKEKEEILAKNQKLLREERLKQKDILSDLKRRQRAEIYALNSILSDIEKSNYEKFKEEKGLPV